MTSSRDGKISDGNVISIGDGMISSRDGMISDRE
jgi:hypothetical protein